MDIMLKKLPYVYPFLVAVAPAVFLWSQNFAEAFPQEVLVTMAVLAAFGAVVLATFWIFYRDTRKAAIITSVTLLFALFYQEIFFNGLTAQFMRHRLAFLIFVTIIAAVAYGIKKTKGDLSTATYILSAIVGIFVLFSLIQLAGNFYTAGTRKAPAKIETVDVGNVKELRDIYYIILDEHTSSDVLKKVLGYSGIDETVKSLEQKGFYVAKQSMSNYPGTHLSLPSALNLRYVDDKYLEDGVKPLKALTEMLENHFLKDFLRSYGYSYLHFGADWTDSYNRYADENINLGLFSPFQTALWRSTAFAPVELALQGRSPLGEQLGFLRLDTLDFRLTQWKRIQFQLQELAKVSERKDGPYFVFAHLLIPHEPYVFDAEGNFVTREEEAGRSTKANYVGQVAYIDKEILKLVDQILQKSARKPIIIIQGDQGHKFPLYDPELLKEEYGLEPEQVPDLLDRIFNAYYLPDGGNQLLYESITPVNSFRIVLNKYFGQKFELLEDKSYSFDPNDSSRFILLP